MSKIEIFKIPRQIQTRQVIASEDGSILFNLIRSQKYEVLEKFCEKLDVNFQRESDGFTPLFVAVSHNKPDIVNLLLQKGANVSIKSKTGHTPLDLALRISNISPWVIFYLINYGGQKLINNDMEYLFFLIRTKSYDELNAYCLNNKSIINKSFNNLTPLTYAIIKNDYFMVDILLAHGAKVDIQTPKTKETPIEIANKKANTNHYIKDLLNHQYNQDTQEQLLFSPTPQTSSPLTETKENCTIISLEIIVTQSINLISKELEVDALDKTKSEVELVTQQEEILFLTNMQDEVNDIISDKSSLTYRKRSDAFGSQEDYEKIMGASSIEELIELIQ